ncbi:hypothetical protein ACFWP7_29230 [Streptomyces sp. NPDC058470]|uniref:hypothetical protein n=1 Tax=Streptomyces sp. NPDC058470 TaxID=3346515 RepID=UPI0036544C2D
MLLPSGECLVVAGTDDAGLDAGCQNAVRYDPATRLWAPTAGMISGRWAFGAIVRADGRLLVAGGTNDVTLDTGYRNAVLYDPLTRAWTWSASMAVPRWDFAATALPDGRVLVVGGAVRSGAAAQGAAEDALTATAEIFGPLS